MRTANILASPFQGKLTLYWSKHQHAHPNRLTAEWDDPGQSHWIQRGQSTRHLGRGRHYREEANLRTINPSTYAGSDFNF